MRCFMKEDTAVKQERTTVTIRLDNRVIDYFKAMSKKSGIPYQTLINLYLLECVEDKKEVCCYFKYED